MLNHIGITINDISEVKNFYQEIMGMKIVKHFAIDKYLSDQVFQINQETDVFLMQKDNMILELFIHEDTFPERYDHICVSVRSRSNLIEKAKNKKYACKRIPRKIFDLVFVMDNAGNKFEVKEK